MCHLRRRRWVDRVYRRRIYFRLLLLIGAVFTWLLQCLSTAALVKGTTIGIDATTLEANAALRSIVRRKL